jgi:hypothetical protein
MLARMIRMENRQGQMVMWAKGLTHPHPCVPIHWRQKQATEASWTWASAEIWVPELEMSVSKPTCYHDAPRGRVLVRSLPVL